MFNRVHMKSLQYSGDSRDDVQDDVTTTQKLVTYTIMFDTTVQNKT